MTQDPTFESRRADLVQALVRDEVPKRIVLMMCVLYENRRSVMKAPAGRVELNYASNDVDGKLVCTIRF